MGLLRFVSAVAITLVTSAAAFAQSAASSDDGLELLRRVAQQYADAKSYYIESVEERTSNSEYDHSWRKTVLTAAEAPGNRYHYEGHSNNGSAMKIGDGKTAWVYRVNERRYTLKPQPAGASKQSAVIAMSEMAIFEAEYLRNRWSNLAKSLKSADRLPDAALMVNGHEVACHLIHFKSFDQKRVQAGYSFDRTIWIDKTRETVLRTIEHADTYVQSGTARIPMKQEITTAFNITELNGPVQESLFTFIPPSDAKLIQDFPDPAKDFGGSDLTGEQVPSLKLRSADGKLVALESFRGKPVLLDVWATWCHPCVVALPQLAQIYQEAKDKGMVLLAVDLDEDVKTAPDFLSKKGYTWPDFHGDGEMENLLGPSPIPRTVLIDAQGKIVYDMVGLNEDELRTEIAKLGPEYAFMSPRPKPAPCVASK